MLRHAAAPMRGDLREVDMAGRVGGEEFAFVLPDTDPAGAPAFTERLRRRVEEAPLAQDGPIIPLTARICVAAMDEADARTDAALVRAKENGRNRVELARWENLKAEKDADYLSSSFRRMPESRKIREPGPGLRRGDD